MKRLFRFISLSIALCTAALSGSAQQVQNLPIDPAVRYGVLDNGLTYYIRHNEEPKGLVNFYIAQKVGSVQEEDNQRGLAHFLEHMCFNGSVNFPEDGALIKYCESIGVKFGQNLNAYTSTDETVYNIDDVPVTPSNIDSCLLIIHDWADGLLLEEAEIDKERGVIHEEWRMRSSATQRILERALPQLYPGSKYGYRMPIGLMEIIDNFEPSFLRNYYETWYRPDLQGVIVVGDIDPDEIEAKIKKIFAPIQMPANPKPYVDYEVPSNEHAIYIVDKDKEMQMAQIIMLFKDEPLPREMMGTMYYYMQEYLSDIVTSVLNSRLNEISLKPDCPFVAAGVSYGNYLVSKTMSALEVDVIPAEGKDQEAIKAVMTEIERARRHGFTATEVIRAREELLSQVERTYENRDKQRSSYYINQYTQNFLTGRAIPGIEMEYQIYQSLAPQIPVEAINEAFAQMTESADQDFVFLGLYPEKDGLTVPTADQFKAAVEAARASEVEAYVDNVKDEPLVSKLPAKGKVKKVVSDKFGFTKLALANGANVYYKKTDFSNTEIVFNATSFGGLSVLPESDFINGSVTAAFINAQGKGNFTSSELEKALAGKQVSLSVSLSELTESLAGSSTPKDLETLFQLIYLSFQEPADDPDAFQSMLTYYKAQLANAETMPTSALQDSITTTLYKNHPRARSIKYADLDKVSYDKIKAIYRNRFSAGGDFDFFFVGNFDEDVLRSYVEQYIAPLAKAKKREKYVDNKIEYVKGVVTNRFTRSMETPQAYIVQAYTGDHPFSLKEAAVVNALGSILDKRYLKSIREDGGMAYSVSTQGQASYGLKEEYVFQTVCPFTPALCDTVLYLMRKDIEAIAENGVTAAELEDVRKFELKDYTDSQRKNSYWLSRMNNWAIWGKDTWTGREDAINSVTSDAVKAFAKDVLLKQNNCTTIIMLPEDMTE